MNREQAFELRDSLLDQLGAMSQDTSHAWSALPSLGVYHGGAEEGWEGGYGLSVLIPEGQEREHFEAWTKHAISEADGEVNVATVGPFRAYACPSAAHLAPGCSISGERRMAGTLGGFVQREDGTLGALSNAHVLAHLTVSRLGSPVYHPGLGDEPRASPFGELVEFVELQGERQINQTDAAIASCDPDKVSIAWPRPGADGYVVGTTDNPDPEEQPAKVGRTTGLDSGSPHSRRSSHVDRLRRAGDAAVR